MTVNGPSETRKHQSEQADNKARTYSLVLEFFAGDEQKTSKWFSTPNPLLGNVAPLDLILMRQSDRLLRFVETQLAQNKRG